LHCKWEALSNGIGSQRRRGEERSALAHDAAAAVEMRLQLPRQVAITPAMGEHHQAFQRLHNRAADQPADEDCEYDRTG
jgi:hypothetical protein